MVPFKQNSRQQQWVQCEFWLLVLTTPLLIFPTVTYSGTALTSAALIAVWLWQKVTAQTPLLPNLPFRFALQLLVFTIIIGIAVSVDQDLTYRKATGVFLGISWLRTLTRTVSLPNGHHYIWGCLGVAAGVIVGMGAATTSWPSKVPALESIILWLPQSPFLLPNSPITGTHVNQLAGALTLLMPISAAWIFTPKSAYKRMATVASIGVFLLLLLLLILSQSRTAYLAVGISLSLGLVLFKLVGCSFKVKLTAGVFILGAIVCGSGVLVSAESPTLLFNATTPTAIGYFDTVAFRHEIWYWAIEATRDFPYTGTGFGTFRRVAQRLYPVAIALDYDGTHAHNIFLQVAVDTGILGLISYCALLLSIMQMQWRIATASAATKAIGISLLCGIVGLHLFGLSDALVLGSKPGILFWLVLGITGHLSLAADD